MRPNFLVAKTVADANHAKSMHPMFYGWHVMTPRNRAEEGWLIGMYMWTPEAKELPARTRWDLRMRLRSAIDEHSDEKTFPLVDSSW